MTKREAISFYQFIRIYHALKSYSSTWSDLWMMIFLLNINIKQIITLKFSNISNGKLIISNDENHPERKIPVNAYAVNIIKKREKLYPYDVYIFQSHSNRTKKNIKPVTHIAFNHILRRTSKDLGLHRISGLTARNVDSE